MTKIINPFYSYLSSVIEPSPRQTAGNVLPVTAVLRSTGRIKKRFPARSLTPPQAARNSLAIAVQYYSAVRHTNPTYLPAPAHTPCTPAHLPESMDYPYLRKYTHIYHRSRTQHCRLGRQLDLFDHLSESLDRRGRSFANPYQPDRAIKPDSVQGVMNGLSPLHSANVAGKDRWQHR